MKKIKEFFIGELRRDTPLAERRARMENLQDTERTANFQEKLQVAKEFARLNGKVTY